jgi:hypothetical protein
MLLEHGTDPDASPRSPEMEPIRFSPQLAWFVRRHIRSVEDLDVLLLVWTDAERWWTEVEVAGRLRISPVLAGHGLRWLAAGTDAVLETRAGPEPAYRLVPSPELRGAVAVLDEAYRQARAQVVAFVAPQPPAAIQDFADAFKLKKKEDE